MRSRLESLAKGNLTYETPDIELSIPALSETLLPGRQLSVDITVSSKNGVPMHLFFCTDNPRIRVRQPYAIGRSIKFSVVTSTVGLAAGDVLKGSICILYNGGETRLPYDFRIGLPLGPEAGASFASFEEFAAFATANPEDAVRAFEKREFAKLPFMQTLKLQGLYQTFHESLRDDFGFSQFMNAAGFPLTGDTKPEKPETPKKTAGTSGQHAHSSRLRALRLFLKYDRYLRTGRKERYPFEAAFSKLTADLPDDRLARLLYAYCLIQEERPSEARRALQEIQGPVQKERTEHKDIYCLFLYLTCLVQKDVVKAEQTVKLIHRYYTDGTPSDFLYYLEYRLNSAYSSDYDKAAAFLQGAADTYGCSPLIREELCFLWEKRKPDRMILTDLELSSMLYGIRCGILPEGTVFHLLSNELRDPAYLNLYLAVLKAGYRVYGNHALLSALTDIYLQQRCIGRPYYHWYRKSAEADLPIPGLYEYFLASVPTDCEEAFPDSVIRYFAGTKEPMQVPTDILYRNVCLYYRSDSEIMQAYWERLRAYADRRIRENSFHVLSAPVLETVILSETPDARNAAAMTEVLSLREIRTLRTDCERVIVHYPELNVEATYTLTHGTALVPVYTEGAILALIDAKGVRCFDPELSVRNCFNDPELLKLCESYMKDALILELADADRIIESGEMDEKDLFTVTSMIREKKTDSYFRARLYEALIDLSNHPAMSHIDCMEFLLEADHAAFSPDYQGKLVDALISREYYAAAYERVLEFGCERVSPDRLLKLVRHLMTQPIGDDEPNVLGICLRLYRDGSDDPAVLQYLAEYYDGSTADMTALAKNLRRKHAPTAGLSERTLIQAFYTNSTEDIDFLFEQYMSGTRRDELLVKAYLVRRAHDYFSGTHVPGRTAVEELKKHVLSLPKVGSLALLSWYASESDDLSEEDRELCETLIRQAVDDDMLLKCFGDLRGKITLPQSLEGRVVMEYRSSDAESVTVIGTVLPGQKPFQRTLTEIYPGVFVRSFILYKREWLKFTYLVRLKDGSIREEEGEIISQEADPCIRGSRYEDAERLEQKVRKDDVRSTAEFLRNLLLKEDIINELFRDLPD